MARCGLLVDRQTTDFYLIPAYNTVFRLNWHGLSVMGARLACIALLWAGIWIAATRTRLSRIPTEYQVKAAIFSIPKVCGLAEDPTTNMNGRWVIGIVGENPLAWIDAAVSGRCAGALIASQGIPAHGKICAPCHILIHQRIEMKRLPAILTALPDRRSDSRGCRPFHESEE